MPVSCSPLNAYVTLAEAKAYLANDSRATAFLLLTDADMSVYLNRATLAIDSQKLRGTKYDTSFTDGLPTQPHEFPRIINGQILNYHEEQDLAFVPADVQTACIEEALELYRAGTGGRKLLQEQGVTQFSLPGMVSESFEAGLSNRTLFSATARQIMRRYTGARMR